MPEKTTQQAPVAVISPLRLELRPFLRHLEDQRRLLIYKSAQFLEARLGEKRLVVGWTGDGAVAAGEGLMALLRQHEISRLVVAGAAGGLSGELDAGRVVVAREVHDSVGPAPEPDLTWALRATLVGAYPGVVLTSDRILVSAAEKSEAYSKLGRPEVATVDLETAVYARIVADRQIPYTALRSVSDTADEDLPVDFNRFTNEDGHTQISRVLSFASSRPEMLAELSSLRKRMQQCAVSLSQTLVDLLTLRRQCR